jgi:hypothetical protein
MPVETIECQIVQAQLGRYLAGDAFPADALAELEDHIARCSICRGEVAKRRATLQALLGSETPAKQPSEDALVHMLREKATSKGTVGAQAVVEQVETKPASPLTQLQNKAFRKPLMYGAALAVVLIAMSYLGNNPTAVFGNRASDAKPSVTTPTTTSATTTTASQAPATGDQQAQDNAAGIDVPVADASPEPLTAEE